MNEIKTQKNFRLSRVALEMLERLSKERGVPQTAILEMAIRDYAKKNLENTPRAS